MSKHEEITKTLSREILVGQYRVGERLPSERDLAARFEANRGAVREAMKKLEQLGIADIQPGGARVVPLNEASLDVIGFLLDLEQVPNRILLDQIFVVINSLVQTAALSAVKRLDDAELGQLRALFRPIRPLGGSALRFSAIAALVVTLASAPGSVSASPDTLRRACNEYDVLLV